MNDRKCLKALKQLEDPKKLKLLYDYAARFYRFVSGPLPGGIEPKDVVHQAIQELLAEGKRTWDDKEYPDVTVPLRGIIRSIMSHTKNQAYYKDRVRPKNEDGKELDVDDFPCTDDKNPQTSLDFSRLRRKIETAIEGDDDLLDIYFAILEGYDPSQEIAEYLGISVKEVNNRLRRLRRKCQNEIEY